MENYLSIKYALIMPSNYSPVEMPERLDSWDPLLEISFTNQ